MISPILACTSVQKAIGYYTECLGFELAWAMPPNEKGETEFAGVTLGTDEIMLGVTEGFVDKADLGKRGVGIQIYINLPESIEIQTYFDQVSKQGAMILKPLEVRPWGEKAFTAKDLDGYSLMFAQTPAPEE
jgi:uncharacterized glyoxalase superfamily protein PhnB